MPKRYKVTFTPEENTEATSTAFFEKVEDDDGDPSPPTPREETVSRQARRKLDDDRASKNRDRWTSAEIKGLLGVDLKTRH
jgi:hypothetical protein